MQPCAGRSECCASPGHLLRRCQVEPTQLLAQVHVPCCRLGQVRVFFFCAKTWAEVAILLLLHEVWVTLQHGNVLLNPFCQRLDRQYGIAMLRRGQHWVIASVLVMYWSREVASMLLCLPYLSFKTQVAIFGSVVYHMVKMLSVCKDAQRKLG